MESEDSDEVTSAENATSSECSLCGNELSEKSPELDSNPLCQECQLKLNDLTEACISRTNEIRKENNELNLNCMKSMKQIFELRKNFESNLPQVQLVEGLNRKIRNLNRDFSDSFTILFRKYEEKNELCRRLNEKQCILEELNEKIRGVNGNSWKTLEELRIENVLLSDKLKDSEIDKVLEVKDLAEAVLCLKNQILRENRMGIRTLSGEMRSLKLLREIRESLEEDLKETLNQINSLPSV